MSNQRSDRWMGGAIAEFFRQAQRDGILVNKAAEALARRKLAELEMAKAKEEVQRRDDLIPTEVAVREYATTSRTIQRRIKSGQLKDYRPKNAPKNAPYLLSRTELGENFRPRK